MAFPKITIDTLVAAPLDTVWTAYTAPAHITRWNFASDDWCCPSAENDMRVGGTYKARMEAKDGSFGFDFEAVYDEVSPKERLVYTLGDGRRVETTFTPESDGVRVTTTFDAEGMHPLEMQRDGWQSILDNFGRHAASL
ncbi:SRPBCC family protein [Seohaeicola zhoushanensis]|uniref:Activator of HSP90 ATPase n=1 Tax=Seohaeicola zhoushanensis TaxID=1569283 RepID=A0A8J3H184_9RHOB|nr:SRPBCC family protein [Seohaeicola zhoushanensis]GHF62955.1 activator of HSP90 ATPase [Seohaeicola zhoushanensis]